MYDFIYFGSHFMHISVEMRSQQHIMTCIVQDEFFLNISCYLTMVL